MHNYYDPLIPVPQENGLAISLGDDEFFGLLDELAAPAPPAMPSMAPVRAANGGVSKKSSKSTLRSRKSAASLQTEHAPAMSSYLMAQSAGAAAGPHAYASVELPSSAGDFRLAPAAAAAALRTPVKQEDAQSPSTVLARTASTVRRPQHQGAGMVAPSPTPATRMRSASKLVAPASDMSPAKGMFEAANGVAGSAGQSLQALSLAPPPQQKSKPPAKSGKAPPKPRKKRAQQVPDMSGAMGSFQVTLSSAEAQPIHVPKPPEKNMQPSVLVGVGAAGTAGASMAARAARASAQQYYYQQPQQSSQPGFGSLGPVPAQRYFFPPREDQAQAQPQGQGQPQGQLQGQNAIHTPHTQHPNSAHQALPQPSHANTQRKQDSPRKPPPQPFTYQYRPLVAPTRRQQEPGALGQSFTPGPQGQHPQGHPPAPGRQAHAQIPTTSRPARAAQRPQSQRLGPPPQLAPPHGHAHGHPGHPGPHGHAPRSAPQRSPQLQQPVVSPFSEASSYSPPLEFDQKSLSPPVFSPPVSRSSSMRSPPDETWMVQRPVETPPTPHASLKVPEVDEFASWTDGVLDDQWDLFSSDAQLRPY